MRRAITLCADDFAQTALIGDAILELCAAQRLSATSVFSQAPSWRALAPQLSEFIGIDVGLHLNLTHSFGDYTRPLPYWLLASRLMHLPVIDLADVFARQLDAFTDSFGRLPDFIDGHQHVHALPQVRDALFEALATYRFPQGLPYLRAPDRLGSSDGGWLKATVLRAASHGFYQRAKEANFPVPGWFGGLYPLTPNVDYSALMAQWLAMAPDGALIMCHPGRGMCANDPIGPARLREFAYFASDQFKEVCERSNVVLRQFIRR